MLFYEINFNLASSSISRQDFMWGQAD